MKKLLLISLLILVSGCIDPNIKSESIVNMMASPTQVFAGDEVSLYFDITNKDTKTINNVIFDVFDPGMFTVGEICDTEITDENFPEIEPEEAATGYCVLTAPSSSMLTQPETSNTIKARISFNTSLFTTQIMKVISQDEYNLRKNTGSLVIEPKTYTYRDKNVELTVEFTEELPIIDKGETEYVHFTIRNIGEGFLELINREDIEIKLTDSESDILECDIPPAMTPIGKEFPKISCSIDVDKINPDGYVNYLSNYIINIDIDYIYEIRKSIPVTIVR